ncbi:hypothetical protein HZC34_01290, partial [Candidatus Saganbacteria bacterium]|nr:hypothetical protein [Candidatus Saganbacteria bacterium]
RWQVLRAYDWVSSHHALGACACPPLAESQSLRDWKKVRAKVNISAGRIEPARFIYFFYLINKNLIEFVISLTHQLKRLTFGRFWP